MFQQRVGDISALLAQMRRCPAEVDGVPMDDGADHQVETGSSEGLAVKGAITDLAALMEKDGAFELVSGLALVEPGLATPTQCRAGILRIADGATVRVVIDAARRRSSSQWSMMRAVLIGTPI